MLRLLFGMIAATILACGPRPPEHQLALAEGNLLRLDRSTVDDGKVHFFTFEHDRKNVNFLVRSDGEGRLHVHLDACFSCYHYRRGFAVEGKNLLCIACRYTYPLADEIWDYRGACAPIPLRFEIEGRWLLIERRVLIRAARYF